MEDEIIHYLKEDDIVVEPYFSYDDSRFVIKLEAMTVLGKVIYKEYISSLKHWIINNINNMKPLKHYSYYLEYINK